MSLLIVFFTYARISTVEAFLTFSGKSDKSFIELFCKPSSILTDNFMTFFLN